MTYPKPRPGRIALVSEHASPLAELGGPDAGGQNVYVAQLAGRLARRGHDVTVYTRRDRTGTPTMVRTPEGVKVVHVPAGPPTAVPKDELLVWMPEFGAYLSRMWRLARPDVVHAHFWMSGLAALAGARESGIPVVQTFHALGTVKRRYQGTEDTSPHERVDLEARIGREADRIVATCADEVNELVAMGVPRTRISVVPCGVDTARFAPVPTAGRPPGAPHRLLSVGRLVPRKGFDRAIKALADVPDAELLIAGGPEAPLLFADPEAERLRKTASEYGVTERVRLLGCVPQDMMPHLMSSADLLLSLPRYEPFGIVPIEAMACGTPVVATAVGGQLDTVVDGVTGTLVPPVETAGHDLAATIRSLLDDPDRRARYGAAGRSHALARYTWDEVADGVARVYAQLCPVPQPSEVAR
ncbi:glycosyltransferase [Streptomyces fulvorobeus]|uniref:D-inositol 3-phosphate glycosyltransferase n=1 Tax=Streptomyces fulvorobeus TaxID=284028 RepID=A0A7J0CEG3_9ACTN|nr:glycosyltransferase [Streptomyces fulvorobeus]NYE44377.1 glycosyltransferase involved in cell wall biosynthesis [Streptomyces fulvorobeus]GFN00902.1 glycosyl transferase [Streptomyces fulvorobeus]